jgi:hypothetical protein
MAIHGILFAVFLLIIPYLTEIRSEFINGAININYGTFEKVSDGHFCLHLLVVCVSLHVGF